MKRFLKEELRKYSFKDVMGSKAVDYDFESDDFGLHDAYALRQGVCDSFSLALHDEFGYEGFYLNEPYHYFCRTVRNGKKYYIDALGTCDSLYELLGDNRITDNDLIVQDFEQTRKFESHNSREGYEFAREFINQHRDHYEVPNE